MNIQKFETYGKQGIIKKSYLEVRNRFIPNKHTVNLLQSKGMEWYRPKVNRVRLAIGILGAMILIVAPFLTILAPLPLLWGLR